MIRMFRVAGGELVQAIKEIQADRERIGKTYTVFGEELGCEQVHTWPWTGRFAGCTFAPGKEPGLADWRLSHHMWVPRRRTVAGRAIWEKASRLEPLPALQTVLENYGLTVHRPQCPNTTCAEPSKVEGPLSNGVCFVSIPWYEPIADWQIPEGWVEVSRFQVLDELIELGLLANAQNQE